MRLFYASLYSACSAEFRRIPPKALCCHLSLFFSMKPDGLALIVVLGVSICDSENPEEKPRSLSVEFEEMLIFVDQETHTNYDSLLLHHSHPIPSFFFSHKVILLITVSFASSLLFLHLSRPPVLFTWQKTRL